MMNVPNKIFMTLFALGTIFWSCDSFIYDDLADCPQGVYVKFYSKTPCDVDSTFIGDVSSLTVFAFDAEDKLVVLKTLQEVALTRDYEVLMPVSDGYFTFCGWAGVTDQFVLGSFTPGVTSKQDVMLTLKSVAGEAADLRGARVWQGESAAVFLPDPAEYASFFEHAAVNLQEVTNRVKVVVEFDESVTDITPKDLAVAVSSANGKINIDGSMPLNTEELHYPVLNTAYTENSVAWDFTLMDLVTGYNNVLKIDYPGGQKVLFDGDLIAGLLLNTVEENINLDCENDFTVKFILKDYCGECSDESYFSFQIYINEWKVNYIDSDLDF